MLTFSLRVIQEDLEDVDVLGARERITTDAYAERLAESDEGGLVHGFVCEGSRAGHNT